MAENGGVETKLKKIFGTKIHIELVMLYFGNEGDYFNNITGIAKKLDVADITAKKAITDLLEAGVLKKEEIGKGGIIFVLDKENPATQLIQDFVESLNAIAAAN